jgi:dipeptidyl aminopeptidase/acylaminoacyl peptidase
VCAVVVASACLAGCAPAGDPGAEAPVVRDRALTLEDYYRIQSVGRPQISPDGDWVLYTVSLPVEEDNATATASWMVRTDGSAEPERVRHRGRSVAEAGWTEDGKLRYTVSRNNRVTRWERDIRNPRSVPHGVGEQQEGIASPDGRWVATLQDIPFGEEVEATVPSDFAQRHEERFEGAVFDWMNFQRDGARFPVPDPRRRPAQAILLRLIDSETPEGEGLRFIADLDLRPTNLVWSPDSRALAFIADAGHRDERTYSRSDIWLVTIDGDVHRLSGDGYTYSSLAFSPDGRYLSFRRAFGTDMVIERRLAHGGPSDLMLWPLSARVAAGEAVAVAATDPGSPAIGEPVNATDDWHLMPGAPRWAPDGRHLYFTAGIGGATHLFRVRVGADGTVDPVEQVTTGQRRISGISFDRDFSKIAFTVGRIEAPSEVWVGNIDGSDERQLSHVHDGIAREIAFSRAERIQYPSYDGTIIEGWLLYPYGYNSDPTASEQAYPLIVNSHGGPHSASGYSFNFKQQLFAANGYFVLQTNFRSSTGYGEAFKWATWGAWGDLDGQDVVAGIDYVLERFPIDAARVGTTGHSYGGFMSNWLITQYPDRFAAAVVGAGISNWISDYGTADIARTKETEFYGPPWVEESRQRLIRQSPITYAGSVRTPTLFVHGEVDQRVPYEEAEQMYFAIKKQGVPAKMIVYAGQSHGIRGHWNQVYRAMSELDWWETYLK